MSDDTQDDGISRRDFIEHVGFMSGTALLYAACKPSGEKAAPPAPVGPDGAHRALTAEEYETVSAAVERIVPRDEEPGALELGVPEYIDRTLATPTMSHVRDEFVRGLEALGKRAQAKAGQPFARLAPDAQDAVLRDFKESPAGSGEGHFWTVLVGLTMEGCFGDPRWGGNKDGKGWALIGWNGKSVCADMAGHACDPKGG